MNDLRIVRSFRDHERPFVIGGWPNKDRSKERNRGMKTNLCVTVTGFKIFESFSVFNVFKRSVRQEAGFAIVRETHLKFCYTKRAGLIRKQSVLVCCSLDSSLYRSDTFPGNVGDRKIPPRATNEWTQTERVPQRQTYLQGRFRGTIAQAEKWWLSFRTIINPSIGTRDSADSNTKYHQLLVR
jgi:hypothetical protein